jgi:hypothetical protein
MSYYKTPFRTASSSPNSTFSLSEVIVIRRFVTERRKHGGYSGSHPCVPFADSDISRAIENTFLNFNLNLMMHNFLVADVSSNVTTSFFMMHVVMAKMLMPYAAFTFSIIFGSHSVGAFQNAISDS